MNKWLYPLLILPLVLTAAASELDDGESPYGKLDNLLTSPHIPFARPHVGGAIRVLVIAPAKTQRETVELSQRLELDAIPLMTSSFESFGPWASDADVNAYAGIEATEFRTGVAAALSNSTNCQAIIVGKVAWEVLPKEIAAALLNRVATGCPLLLIARDGSVPALPDCPLNPVSVHDIVQWPAASIPTLKIASLYAGQWGKGRVLGISYPAPAVTMPRNYYVESLTPFESNDPLDYDACHAFLAKCLLSLVAPDRPRLQIAAETLTVHQADLPGVALPFRVLGDPPVDSRIIAEIRDRDGLTEFNGTAVASSAALPFLTSGRKLLFLKLTNTEGQVIDFTGIVLNVQSKVSIATFALAQRSWKPGEHVTGTVTLNAPFAGKVIVELADSHGRIMARTEASGTAFTLPSHGIHTRSGRVTLLLKDNDRRVAQASRIVYFDRRGLTEDFQFTIWANCHSDSRINEIALSQLKQSGVDIVMDTGVMWLPNSKRAFIPEVILRADMAYAPYAARLAPAADQYEHIRPEEGEHGLELLSARQGNCVLDFYSQFHGTGDFPAECDTVRRIAEGAKGLGTAYYNLGDENALALPGGKGDLDICYCPQCQTAFRRYAQQQYASLDALNHEWNTKFKSWDDVHGVPLEKAWADDQAPRWVDYRLFMEQRFVDYHRLYVEAVRSVDPEAPCGIEGICYPYNSFMGFNLYELLPLFDFFAPYGDPRELHAMKYLQKGALTGAWFGSYEGEMNRIKKRHEPWFYLFKGLNSVAWWTAGGMFSSGGLSKATVYRADLGFLRHYEDSAGEIRRIKESGVGMLLYHARKHIDPIAVHYSNNSLHASTIRPEESTWKQSHEDVNYLLTGVGMDYAFLSPPELIASVPANVKVLFLPYSQALAAAEVEAIKRFVHAGGLLIADFQPGIMNEHGKRLPDSSLRELFGPFKRLSIRRYGQGQCLYLDDYIAAVEAKMQQQEAAGIQRGMLRMLDELAGVRPVFTVSDEHENPCPYDLFTNDAAKYLCLLGPVVTDKAPKSDRPEAQGTTGSSGITSPRRRVDLQQPCHIYDILSNHRYLGEVDSFEVDLDPGVGRVFACLPWRVEGLDLKLDTITCRPGSSVTGKLRLRHAGAGNSGWVASIRIYAADGSELSAYNQRLYATGDERSFAMSIPLNTTLGNYRIVATDAASGATAEQSYTVE